MAKDLRAASESKSGGVISDLAVFMSQTKKWWLAPIVVMLLLLGVLILVGGSGAAPFIYTIF